MIVLDTNVVSEFMRPHPDAAVVGWLNAQDMQTLHLTAVSLAELRFGIARLDEGRTRADLSLRLDRMLEQVFPGRILPFTASAAQAFADRMAEARRAGRAVGFQDGMIAATVVASGCAIATRDTAPFEAMGLVVTNPWITAKG
ncbi:MAG: type II toxin-antitoxin system VapC family toxin [Tabrizicola sp.]|nr:type II toxin-antitoxin system VapC family toxin [Tabrizicola sp.]